jgi:dTDP-4-dehydrorhamnose 3,5-epimerase
MEVTRLELPDVMLLSPRVFTDERGYFFESFNARTFQEDTGLDVTFVQDNHSYSKGAVLRGLHYQVQQPQGKLVRVISGAVFDVAVDLRRRSPSFGRSVGVRLSADQQSMLWIPAGFAHGFFVLSEAAEFLYKTTDYWAPQHERTLLWSDPDLNIAWPFTGQPVINAKDAAGLPLARAEVYD